MNRFLKSLRSEVITSNCMYTLRCKLKYYYCALKNLSEIRMHNGYYFVLHPLRYEKLSLIRSLRQSA